ncbi:ABC-F family ATP-binding cassette domain-containing protein [Desulfuromonas sp. KJ2020]|uniref:ABC-F family ATP-binding cassette domain-containing protein n=1 Tax=Desulfuromonas sp. KJ2020 TaxID=2919173 RepID=UPI0020A72931|nr:ABC-F family ATP-binding cassette domain-containing protein [Desulfuromonas sp. KJ2020]MCP3175586.1 ABC-F family ATP-binding cassette domain-containing protein [Desulfuromonas sp. KJ2020]
MNVIDITDLHKSYGARTVLAGIGLTLGEEEKVGVIGRNGCGKSTLLRIIAGLESADAGRVIRKRDLTAVYLPQEPELDPTQSIRQTLDAALGEARRRLSRFQTISDELHTAHGEAAERLLHEQHEIQSWLDLHGAWNLDHKVADLCGQLGLVDPRQRVGELSGGGVKRVALAAALLREPELLLLDEPTNHLDADTVAWLETALRTFAGAVMLVTHDRYFLDRVVNRMFEIDQGQLTSFAGGYSAYLEQKQELLLREERSQDRLLNLLRREEAWLRRGAKARTTKQKARIDRVEQLQGQKKTGSGREMKLELEMGQRLGGTILELAGLTVEMEGRPLIRDLDLIMRKGERIGILGPNGCGKTTLLRTVLGELSPAAGTVVLGKNTRIGYLDQARSGLDPEQFVHEAVGEGDWVTVAGHKRHKIGYLEDFLFSRDEQRKRISTLSGGERARLLLAKLMLEEANLIILDEPTNDLDIPTMQVLEEAFNAFPGCVLVVTHDRWFLDRIATGILHFEPGGRMQFSEGNYEDFCRLQALQAEEAAAVKTPLKAKEAEVRVRKRAGLSYKEQRELEAVEAEIAEREAEMAELEAMLSDPARLGGDSGRLEETARQFAAAESRLEELMARWEELEVKKAGE